MDESCLSRFSSELTVVLIGMFKKRIKRNRSIKGRRKRNIEEEEEMPKEREEKTKKEEEEEVGDGRGRR